MTQHVLSPVQTTPTSDICSQVKLISLYGVKLNILNQIHNLNLPKSGILLEFLKTISAFTIPQLFKLEI